MRLTSESAEQSIEHIKDYVDRQIIVYLEDCPEGSTHQEAEDFFAWKYGPSTIRWGFTRLLKAGLVYDTGRYRSTRAGRRAIVWASVFRPYPPVESRS